jgi:hypothetical protein
MLSTPAHDVTNLVVIYTLRVYVRLWTVIGREKQSDASNGIQTEGHLSSAKSSKSKPSQSQSDLTTPVSICGAEVGLCNPTHAT